MATITGYIRGLEGDVPDAAKVFINMITERGVLRTRRHTKIKAKFYRQQTIKQQIQ